jgi:hypothetical protein
MKGRKKAKAPLGGGPTSDSGILQSAGDVADPTREEIERRAYEIYEERGVASGSPEDDWLRAEGELRAAKGTHSARPSNR